MSALWSWLDLAEVMRVRYDAFSARAVLDEAILLAGLTKKATYPADEIERIAASLAAIRRLDRTQEAVAALRARAAEARAAQVATPAPEVAGKAGG